MEVSIGESSMNSEVTGKVATLGFTAVVLACFIACGDNRRSLSPIAPIPPQPGPPILADFKVSGPTTVHIGETARFTATASYSDGSARDVTSEANWQVASE